VPVKAEQLIILIGNDFNSKFSELQITIRKKNVVPCPKRGNVTHALSEANVEIIESNAKSCCNGV
jgi:hypothetical protein